MQTENINWARWQRFFASRSERQLPELETPEDYSAMPASLAASLAIFQLGESGGGTIIDQARQSTIKGIDDHYANAMQLFVNEEHRHAEILAICIRNLGGNLIKQNWTARLFVFGRRLIGLRLKVTVLLAAEVVGICYYHLLATRLPPSRLKSLLAQLVNDERAHLHFHTDFLRSQVKTAWQRAVFVCVWRITMAAAAVVVLIDHRRALRELDLTTSTVLQRWSSYSSLAEQLVITSRRDSQLALPALEGLADQAASFRQITRQCQHVRI
jgi:hypothetical protein